MSYRCLYFILVLFPFSLAGFAEIPTNVTVVLGTATPPIRCRHMTLDAHISWRMNGSPSGQFSDIRSGFVNESGTIVDTLTIPAEPQYNGTVVEFVAVLFDGSLPQVSPAATIFFTLAVSPPETTHFEMTPTNTPPVAFEVTPSRLTVAVEQGTVTFQCQHSLAVVIGWRVNRMSLNMANLPNVSSATHINATTILSIATLLEYNGTIVECIAAFIDGSPPQFAASGPI